MKTPALQTSPAQGHVRPAALRQKAMGAWLILATVASGVCGEASASVPLATLKKMSVEELMNLEVTSVSRRPEKIRETPSAIQVVTSEEIRRAGVSSIPEALRLANNLQVARKNPHDWAISARGFNTALSNKLLVLLDGRTVYTPLFSGVFWNLQDYLLEDVDRIEAISGPGGTLWGANAVNGVINITTKSAADTQGFFLEAGAGTELQAFGGVRYGGTLAPGVHYRIYGKYSEHDGGVLANGRPAANDSSMLRGGFRIDARASPKNALTLQGDLYGGDETLITGGILHTTGGNLLGRWTHRTGDDSEFSLQLYYDHTNLTDPIPAGAFAVAGILTDDLDTYDLDFQHRLNAWQRHVFVWGFGYRFTHNTVSNSPAVGFFPTRLDHRLYSAFVQDEIQVTKTLSLTLGTKLEHNDYTGLEVGPSGRLRWNPSAETTVWMAVSRAVRTPSRIDRDTRQPSAGINILSGGPNFRSESVVAYELGYRAQLTPKISGSISTFYNEYDHVRSLGFTPLTIIPLFFKNDLEAETYGFELNANFTLHDRWRLQAGYNVLREDVRIKAGGIDLNNALNETADPSAQYSLRSAIDLTDTLEFDVGLRHVEEFTMNNGGAAAQVPGYTELDARLAWRPVPHVEVTLVGQNLLHNQHAEYGAPGPGREEIERGFYGKVTWRY